MPFIPIKAVAKGGENNNLSPQNRLFETPKVSRVSREKDMIGNKKRRRMEYTEYTG